MPSLKEIRARIKSVQTTQQTTRAMKMVAASKLRRAQDNMIQFRPYAAKLRTLLDNLAASAEGQLSSPYAEPRSADGTVLLVLVTSNRGLCGAFNANVLKRFMLDVLGKYAEKRAAGKLKVLCVGKRGYDFVQRRGLQTVGENHDVFAGISFDKVNAVASEVMDGFTEGHWDEVVLYYNSFKNVATTIPVAEKMLPVVVEPHAEEPVAQAVDYIFEPAKEEMLVALIPDILRSQFYRVCLESNAAEQGARMIAMDNATENAQELIDKLKLIFNKARQASITKEILEIVSGAEALSGK
ncbi:MAG: ATP synthase F1 subunit gamma [Bacteroidetes bacterium]|nr:ATP synthase F1 subunit gamma [Bacteroidota bacterium]